MSEMVERVARAIEIEIKKRRPDEMMEPYIESAARAAIEAMREPVCTAIRCGCGNYCDFDEAEEKLNDLFDAALSE